MGISDSYKSKTIGILGLGSIGMRHAEALRHVGVSKISALRTGRGQKKIPNELANIVESYTDINKLSESDFFIISTPTSMHFESLRSIIHFRKPIFIEKPLCNSYDEATQIAELLTDYPAKIQIGFCLRFKSLLKEIKKIIDSGELGNIVLAKIECGHFLPLWHPYTDYRQEYFSRKDLGGGALRTLSHELDLALFLFGQPLRLQSLVGKLSGLEIDVDDYANLLLQYEDKTVRIEVDFLQKNISRNGLIMGALADLHYDLIHNIIRIYNKSGALTSEIKPIVNDMYYDQMESFLDINIINEYPSLADSLFLMKMIESAEQHTRISKWFEL